MGMDDHTSEIYRTVYRMAIACISRQFKLINDRSESEMLLQLTEPHGTGQE
jgi:hypothetical protein